ncbi:MAG TPA: hypothetical protein VGL86_20010 [Polyangia bacterium]|jgi:hypothetical protein
MRALVLFALGLGGCLYSPSISDDVLQCDDGRCPDNFYCASDNRCWQRGHLYGGGSDGGADLSAGGVGGSCGVASDCASGICNLTTNSCAASDCGDGVRDDQETDVDCGGPSCPGCATGQSCSANGDCANQLCNSVTMTCVANSCGDGILDGTETDVDCGGACATKCKEGQVCLSSSDCAPPGACDGTHHCVAAQCTNGVQDSNETDVDCGGTVCAPCPLGKKCGAGADCASSFCNAQTKLCVADQCHDGLKDGSESDVDCGGGCATKCGGGQMCSGPSDCSGTGVVCDGAHVCCTPSCSGKVCGSDGCGGSCGTCTSTTTPMCAANGASCQCTASSCASLGAQYQCSGGQCACVPSCAGKSCGPDGCGGQCGTCPGYAPSCNAGVCECSGSSCSTLGGNYTCVGGGCSCTPSTCASLGKVCGQWSNGCGSTLSCPNCGSGMSCNSTGTECLISNGASCSTPSQCVSGACECSAFGSSCQATVCCNRVCGQCELCISGSCTPVPNSQTPGCHNGTNGNNMICDGTATCGVNNGGTCAANSQCVSGCCANASCPGYPTPCPCNTGSCVCETSGYCF